MPFESEIVTSHAYTTFEHFLSMMIFIVFLTCYVFADAMTHCMYVHILYKTLLCACIYQMCYTIRNVNMSEPMDIDDGELVRARRHRQETIEGKLLASYAKEMAGLIHQLVEKNCNGCRIEHGSQREHDCIMMENEERLRCYFDEALNQLCECNVMMHFAAGLKTLSPPIDTPELLKYASKDWKKRFCTEQEELFNETILEFL